MALVIMHGLLVGADAALGAVRKGRLGAILRPNDRSSKALRYLRENPEATFATLRLGRTLLVVMTAALSVLRLAPRLEAIVVPLTPAPWMGRLAAMALVIVGAALFLVTVGDFIPRVLARRHPERSALSAAPTIARLVLFMGPFVWAARLASRWLILPFGASTQGLAEKAISEEDLKEMLLEAGASRMVDPVAGLIARRAVDFGKLTAGSVMVPRNDVVAVSAFAKPEEILQALLESGHSRLLVYYKSLDDIVGYIAAKDVLALTQERQLFVVQDLLRPVHFVAETTRAGALLEEMQKQCIHLACVADEQGGLAGIVTMDDLLEELVGDIFSERRAQRPSPIRREGDGALLVDGTVPVRDVNRELDVALREGESWSTIAGLCIALAGHIPRAGEKVTGDHGVELEVVDASPRRVKSVRIRVHRARHASEH